MLTTRAWRAALTFSSAGLLFGVTMAGCSSNNAGEPTTAPTPTPTANSKEPPRTLVDGVEVPVTYGDFNPAATAVAPLATDPPHLLIDATSIPGTIADWSAISSISPDPLASAAPPNWQIVSVPGGDEPLTLTFDSGPLPAAVSVVGYEAIGDDGLPTGEPQRDHGVIPAAGVTEADGHLTLDMHDRPEYLAVQFRWLVPANQRAGAQLDSTSVTATYLLHLGPVG